MTIIAGWRKAADIARKALKESAIDSNGDKEKLRRDLVNVAKTTLSSKILSSDKDKFANLGVDAVLRLDGSTDLDLIQIIKKPGGSLTDSYLEEGFLLEKSVGIGQPKRIENANILLANTPMDTDKIKVYGSRVKVSSMDKVAEIEAAEKEKMRKSAKRSSGMASTASSTGSSSTTSRNLSLPPTESWPSNTLTLTASSASLLSLEERFAPHLTTPSWLSSESATSSRRSLSEKTR